MLVWALAVHCLVPAISGMALHVGQHDLAHARGSPRSLDHSSRLTQPESPDTGPAARRPDADGTPGETRAVHYPMSLDLLRSHHTNAVPRERRAGAANATGAPPVFTAQGSSEITGATTQAELVHTRAFGARFGVGLPWTGPWPARCRIEAPLRRRCARPARRRTRVTRSPRSSVRMDHGACTRRADTTEVT